MGEPIVLSPLEFDVAWETESHEDRHPWLDTPSPGTTWTERAEIVARTMEELQRRRLARGGRVHGELADRLALLANYRFAAGLLLRGGQRVSALGVCRGNEALLAVVNPDEVWLVPTTPSSLPRVLVAVTGEGAPGYGRSVSVSQRTLEEVGAAAAGEPNRMITALESRGLRLSDAQQLAGMYRGIRVFGEFGVEQRERDGVRRLERVLRYFDSDNGRFAQITSESDNGDVWVTVTPSDNEKLIMCVRELLDEL